MTLHRLLVAVATYALLIAPVLADGFKSPLAPVHPTSRGEARSTTSPNGRYVVKEFVSEGKDEPWDYRLDLTDRHTKRQFHLYTHHRFAILRWSPNSRRIALTDDEGSNAAECYIIRLPNVAISSPDERIFKLVDVNRLLGGEVLHLYADCERWITGHSIIVHVWGNGVIPGATGPLRSVNAHVLYSLSGKSHLLSIEHDP